MKKTLLQKGFTLIEMIVVIAIISILTAIVTSNFTASKAKARDSKRVSDLAQIQLALALYFDRCNVYPGAITTDGSNLDFCPGVLFGDYISVVPRESASTPYDYKTNIQLPSQSKATNYVLHATLEKANSAPSDRLIAVPAGINNSAPAITCDAVLNYCVTSN